MFARKLSSALNADVASFDLIDMLLVDSIIDSCSPLNLIPDDHNGGTVVVMSYFKSMSWHSRCAFSSDKHPMLLPQVVPRRHAP